MWANLQFPTDLDTFTEAILNGKLHFLFSDMYINMFALTSTQEVLKSVRNFIAGAKFLFAEICSSHILFVLWKLFSFFIISNKRFVKFTYWCVIKGWKKSNIRLDVSCKSQSSWYTIIQWLFTSLAHSKRLNKFD